MVHPKKGSKTTSKKCRRKKDNFFGIKYTIFNFGNKIKIEK
jgi:hypothetical protein